MIEVYNSIPEHRRAALEHWLRDQVRPHLKPDVSGYARGRLRAWLEVEPSLTNPVTHRPGLPVGSSTLNALATLIDWRFDYCLVTFSGDEQPIGITPHRDARYADFEARGLNVCGSCVFDYWEGRRSFGRGPAHKEYDPKTDAPTSRLQLKPGDCLRFNCKNLHAASPSADRWALNFWRRQP